ncbi:O-acetyl-ADP-ribose deacetylase [Photobacterium rosenbergii]|uniref:O-acetyl-ADP-ribose deacetylase n=1 Tax=Photobacterium rosenbergii TaxID=294936 RepID=A0A2T3NJM0_9GAMM|nr:O-acetyl-ADP-ribose deacetylase [Photobacterium rosenbergii]PSW15670.1 O-acetyl-ADP-ribose deacetylase [Photobacterium rosenbergii]
MGIHIVQGDITRALADAIVNAANPTMLGGGGVDGAIHRAAGPELLAACKQVPLTERGRCPFGEARITAAGKLNARYVIHTAGPIYSQSEAPALVLASSYRNSMRLALENGCKSIAFPAISCGVYGYPLNEAAEIAVSVCLEDEFKSLEKTFYLFGEDIVQVWRQVLSQHR